jgi:pimeloyl-ACP methyl ester carboxylesterase
MIHGFPDDANAWKKQIDYFSATCRVIAPYLRGIGPSEASDDSSRSGPDAVALDLLEILRQADPDAESPVWLMGHDIGAAHAWHLARLLGPRLKGLIVINGASVDQMLARALNPRQLAKSWYIAFFMLPILSEWAWKKFGATLLRRKTAAGAEAMLSHYRQCVLSLASSEARDPAPVQAPVLVMWGNHDAYLEIPSESEMARLAPKCTIRVLKGEHWIHQDDAAHVNQLIKDFMEQNG